MNHMPINTNVLGTSRIISKVSRSHEDIRLEPAGKPKDQAKAARKHKKLACNGGDPGRGGANNPVDDMAVP